MRPPRGSIPGGRWNRARRIRSTLFTAAALLGLAFPAEAGPAIAIQPLGPVDAATLRIVRAHVESTFVGAQATVLAQVPLPRSAWYAPRQRHRAEKLVDHLHALRPPGAHIVGLTVSDISTTKGEHHDWGIFGLGLIGQGECVVSEFRLGRGVGVRERRERLRRIVVHELGHAFGLDHCAKPRCVMQDALGSIATIDESAGAFCPRCRALLRSLGIPAA